MSLVPLVSVSVVVAQVGSVAAELLSLAEAPEVLLAVAAADVAAPEVEASVALGGS